MRLGAAVEEAREEAGEMAGEELGKTLKSCWEEGLGKGLEKL